MMSSFDIGVVLLAALEGVDITLEDHGDCDRRGAVANQLIGSIEIQDQCVVSFSLCRRSLELPDSVHWFKVRRAHRAFDCANALSIVNIYDK